MPYVVEAMINVNIALANVDAGETNVPPTSLTASTTKIVEMRTEKISSVNRVKYLTKFEADVMELKNKIPAVQRPVHVSTSKKKKKLLALIKT